MIPFRVTRLTETAKLPTKENEGDLWDLYANDFCIEHLKDRNETMFKSNHFYIEYLKDRNETMFKSIEESHDLAPMGRVLVKTGISLELPIQYSVLPRGTDKATTQWFYIEVDNTIDRLPEAYAVADIRPRSGLALKHGITVLNSPGTIDNSYRKEIGVILYNAGHEAYTITKGDKIAQMLIRPLYPSQMEEMEDIKDTGRGGYGSTGK